VWSAANPGAEPCRALAKATGGLAGPLSPAADRANDAAFTLLPVSRRSEEPEGPSSVAVSQVATHGVALGARRAPLSFPDTLSPWDNWTNRHNPQNRCDRDNRENRHRPYHRTWEAKAKSARIEPQAARHRAFKSEVRLKRLCGQNRLKRL
jgi:hypothetical protein